MWRTYATVPKTADSAKPVRVIEPLRSILVELREADGNPVSGPILRGPKSGRVANHARTISPTALFTIPSDIGKVSPWSLTRLGSMTRLGSTGSAIHTAINCTWSSGFDERPRTLCT